MDPLLALAEEHDLAVVEDACQAHGALYKGRKVGALGAAGAFSFYPTKNLGAYGEGGALVTDDAALAERARLLRAHGQDGPYRHAFVGYNYRMHGIQGAVLGAKLRRLDEWNERRRAIAARYAEGLAGLPVRPLREADYARCVWHLYPIRCEERDALQQHLGAGGVTTGVHYPVLLPELEALRPLGLRSGELTEARRWADRELSLPLFAELTDEQADYVTERVRSFF
jgi:dTDP-4-amino-4,6-dideoxygalactose transaminase